MDHGGPAIDFLISILCYRIKRPTDCHHPVYDILPLITPFLFMTVKLVLSFVPPSLGIHTKNFSCPFVAHHFSSQRFSRLNDVFYKLCI
jgi:hypothetical protein